MQHIKQVLTAVMLLMGGMAWAQTNGQFVIKTTVSEQVHYLSHAGNALGDATQFSPNVLWTSDNTHTQGGTNRNYYFMEGNTPHFLAAPNFTAGGALDLSPSLPPGNQLSTPEAQYYFYKWDGGLGRGVQYYGDCANNPASCVECGHVWGDDQCWDVYWVAYVDATWKLSGKYYDLDDVPSGGGRYYPVTITEHGVEVSSGATGGLAGITVPAEMEWPTDGVALTASLSNYTCQYRPAYTTYFFDNNTHNYYNGTDNNSSIPELGNLTNATVQSYLWTISGDGSGYLSFYDEGSVLTSNSESPTLYYRLENSTGHKPATITLTVTYSNGITQTETATVVAKTPCANPGQEADPVVTHAGVTVSWYHTADQYKVYWQKEGDSEWSSVIVNDDNSYTFTNLEFRKHYYYKVAAFCNGTELVDPSQFDFTTLKEPGMVVLGAIFGGGRMADVGGMTEVVVVNCDSIGAIFGGNDIAGTVLDTISANHEAGFAGANITLGVDAGGTYASYGTTPNNGKVRVSSVYGGGNGYYAYNGSSFVPATSSYTSETVAVGSSVKAMTQFHQVGDVVWTNDGAAPKTLNFPSITNTAIIATNNLVKVDSIFGGAKNAFLTANSGDGDSIVINGGTVFAVFGGNNWGGGQGYGIHHIEVNGTKTKLVADIANSPTEGYGRDFGIRYLFGGGNKVAGSTTDIHIKGGQSDEVFAGGNAADVYKANVTVECSLGADEGDHLTFGDTYTNAINHESYTSGTIGENTVYTNYGWDGLSGIYNVRTLYGGNNEAEMQRVPNVTLTSGSVGTVYGGGNAGDMMGSASTTINGNTVLYGTHVVLNSNRILTDYIYGGCRMSDVLNSTWVELKKGHVGTVYGGCNISGDVGSTRFYDPYPSGETYPQTLEEQRVKGATYVQTGDGGSDTDLIVYKDLFAGSNGYYHCSSDGIHYNEDELFGYPETLYAGMDIPTHNETNVVVTAGTTVKGNVYAGGNLAPVGFFDNTGFYRGYPELVGMATVVMTGGRVEQNVYGGGNMASIFGRNEVKVSGGTIVKGLYGGNDRAGQVAERTNRKLPTGYGYTVASDNETSLTNEGVMTFVGVSGNARIGTVYGGGNGDYTYGGEGGIPFCGDTPSHPIQPFTFVDIHLAGGSSGGKIGTVYGGGNGVTVRGGAIVFMNIVEPEPAQDYTNVDTIFGGNNKGNIEIVPDIRLLHGQVGTVYGGCNQGAMMADNTSAGNTTVSVGGYENIGSYVRLRNEYRPNGTGTPVTPTAKVTEAVYGGCRMNGVNRNSLVLVEGGDFTNTLLFGGSDISGTVSGFSRVAVTGGTVGNVYGGGNGGYYYKEVTNSFGTYYQVYRDETMAQLLSDSVPAAPICAQSGADILGGSVGTSALLTAGTVAQVFGGGYGKDTQTTGDVIVNVGNKVPTLSGNNPVIPNIYGDIYGGSAFGNVNTNPANTNPNPYTTTVNFFNGVLKKATVGTVDYGGNLFGGGLGRKDDLSTSGVDESIAAKVYGKVFVNISSEDQTEANCFIDLRDANIFGCNNTNGSPQDDVEVHVWKTAHTDSDSSFYIGTTPSPLTYAIDQVFGGGNQADYAPEDGATDSQKKTLVYVHNCSNTIHRVFSGGNAAAATGVSATIEGGRFDYVFGGGNGEVDPANIGLGGTNLVVSGGKINHLFGGSNQTGAITGETYTEINGGNASCMEQHITEFFGGSNMAEINSGGRVYSVVECGTGTIDEVYGGCNKAHITGNVILDIKGGTIPNVYGGSKGVAGEGGAANIDGNVTLNLMGGEITNAFGGSNINGNITGNITVNVVDYELTNCGLDLTNVYGGGNETPYTPGTNKCSVVNVIHIKQDDGIKGNVFGGAKGSTALFTANPIVNIGYNATTMSSYVTGLTVPNSPRAYVKGNVFGGGDAAPVDGSTKVNVFNGEIVHKLVGGGNEAGVSMNSEINVYGGSLCTTTEDNKGIYGGCNNNGTVGENTFVTLTGGTIGATGNGANVHGGGYGSSTSVAGNVTVSFGANDNSPTDLILYGDLYGGSALGSVNSDGYDVTTVNVYNGTIEAPNLSDGVYANVFGGGLGDENHPAVVNGVVHVNIGSETGGGNATLTHCNVFGCNNQNGSPQDDVFVDVYQTAHTLTDAADYFDNDRTYAIYQVFGGGNEADYRPEDNNLNSSKKTHVTVHGCENTVRYVYGGSNAAYAVGVVNIILGGRFDEVYGGGNGRVHAADIGSGGIGLNVVAGNVSFLFEGSNKNGTNYGPFYKPDASSNCLGGLFVDSYFFGTNEAELYGDLNNIITCAESGNFEYRNVFAGSRWGIVYGDITLTVCGGIIENLFGGCRGYEDYSADVRRFPTFDEIDADIAAHSDPADRKYSQDLLTHMGYPVGPQPSYAGHGGNIHLIVNGGTIGNVFGGCDIKGNVEGKISVTVCDVESTSCPLFVGNVYGASNMWYHNPEHSDINSPEVRILKGTVGGSHPDLPVNNIYGAVATDYEGNVFGGGNHGDVKANPRVIVGDGTTGTTATRVTIKGDVYGGGNEGNVTGSPNVIVVPAMHTLTISAQTGGAVTVYNGQGSPVASGSNVGEGVDVQLIARPADYAHKFTGWTVTGAGAGLSDPNAASTVLTMGTENVTVTATFTSIDTHTLTFNTSPTGGTFTVTGANGSVSSGSAVGEGVVLNLVATASPYGYKFKKWTVTGTGASVANDNAASTTFTMGTTDATIVAEFEEVLPNALTITPASDGSFTVKDYQNNTVADGTDISAGALLYLEATPASGYAFSGWTFTGEGASVANKDALETTFTMGTEASSITASFAPVHTLTVASPANGLIRVMDALGHTVNDGASIGYNAILNIKAMPHSGYAFKNWTVSDEDFSVSVLDANVPITSFTMGSSDATIDAEFVTAHILTINAPDEMVGTVKVTNPDLNQNVSSPASIGEYDVLNLVATPATGYHFVRWNLEGGGTVGNATAASTTFTMGTVDSTITAVFEHE